MTARATVEVSPLDVERITTKLGSRKLIEEPMHELLLGAQAFAEADVREESRDLGAISRSFVAASDGWTAAVVSRHPGAVPMDVGRHSSKQPPVEALAEWAQAHGLGGLEFVIARAIARRGTKGRFFREKTVTRLREVELPRLIEAAKLRIAEYWDSRL